MLVPVTCCGAYLKITAATPAGGTPSLKCGVVTIADVRTRQDRDQVMVRGGTGDVTRGMDNNEIAGSVSGPTKTRNSAPRFLEKIDGPIAAWGRHGG
jgi:hypothetical protein